MEGRIAELEKKLMEEREKVLLASLRSKEEEAVSAKVETSIKEIQDKLRREKREQELDENKRKAETRALELERRMAEEREAWVSHALKTQLSQRDQATQEMEGHFSTRLKDLEYRWAQEKTTLENAIREKEGELARVRLRNAAQERAGKSVLGRPRQIHFRRARQVGTRELERAKDKLQPRARPNGSSSAPNVARPIRARGQLAQNFGRPAPRREVRHDSRARASLCRPPAGDHRRCVR